MLDPKLIRESPDLVRAAIAKKHLKVDLAAVLGADAAWRAQLQDVEQLRSVQKAANAAMAALAKGSPEFMAKVAEMKAVSSRLKEREAGLKAAEERCREAMLTLPNLPHPSVPEGATPEANVVYSTHGDKGAVAPGAVPHWDVPGFSRLFDFERGAKVTGAGFPFFVGEGARLARALINFFLERDVAAGFREVMPPILVNRESVIASGHLSKFGDVMFSVEDGALFLSPTAEVQLVNLHRDEILEADALPKLYVAYTPCFREEAGAAGKDTRGLIRQHQFEKVELVGICAPADGPRIHDRITEQAESLLQALELPYRVVVLSSGDTGFASRKTYDLEVWLPGQNAYREISSCSTCGDFQARRAGIRFRSAPRAKPEFAYTLNGSGLAVGRTLVAILENYQQRDGSVNVPAVLRPYMGGLTAITNKRT